MNSSEPVELFAGNYRVGALLGEGGMGAVYEATHALTGRRVALKHMLAARSPSGEARTPTPAEVERFIREARAAASVEHPNVVDVLDLGQNPADGSFFIVYERLEGETLRARLDARGRLDVAEAAAALLPVMDALAAVHRAGIVHRDLKPENIFLARLGDGRVAPKVIDFGIAKVDDADGGEALTRTGVVLGTARYLSPEQARGARDVDARADVWALGVVWFEALTGRAPFTGDSYNAILASILTEEAASLREALPSAPVALAAAVDRALARDRAARWASMRDFHDAVTAALAAPAAGPPPAPRRSPSARALAAIAVALACVAAAWAFGRDAPSTAPARSPPALAAAPVEARHPSAPPPADARAPEPSGGVAQAPDVAPVPRRAAVSAPRRAPRPEAAPRPIERTTNNAPVLEP